MFDIVIRRELTSLAEFFHDVFVLTTDNEGIVGPQKAEPGSVKLFFSNPEKLLNSLPYLISKLNTLNRELARHLLRTQDYIMSRSSES